MLDARGGPNGWGNFLMPTTSFEDKDSFIQQPQFFHLAHFAKYVKPGSKRIQLDIVCGARHVEYCQGVAFLTPDAVAVVVLTNDRITGSPLAEIPLLGNAMVPRLARGEKAELAWTLRCRGSEVSGVLPWKGIQTIIMPCGEEAAQQ